MVNVVPPKVRPGNASVVVSHMPSPRRFFLLQSWICIVFFDASSHWETGLPKILLLALRTRDKINYAASITLC